MECYVVKNEKGEYFSTRSGRCSPDFNPFSHLFKTKDKADRVVAFRDDQTLHREKVRVSVSPV